MILKAINDGKVSSTGSMTVESGMIGGILVTTDGNNAAVITIQRNDSSGKKVFDISTLSPGMITVPLTLEDTTTAYYSVTGTGASAQFFEWVT